MKLSILAVRCLVACSLWGAVAVPTINAAELNLTPEQAEQLAKEKKRMADSMENISSRFNITPSLPTTEGQIGTDTLPRLQPGQGVVKMQDMMNALRDGKEHEMSPSTAKSLTTGVQSGTVAAELDRLDPETILSVAAKSAQWQLDTAEAYVNALPPRDQALGRSILLGDSTSNEFEGKLYVFVSRSMPMSLLRAYAVDAAYSGATLVMKGIRKGDTVQEYVVSMMDDFNSAEGQVLATTEINPNLFDMFKIDVVPTVVWTNRVGLDETGSGCQAPPDILMPYMDVPGPHGSPIRVERPTCIPVPDSAYYKLAGALKLDYVLERFVSAGAPERLLSGYRDRIAERHANVHEKINPELGNALTPLFEDVTIDRLPSRLLEEWNEDLKVMTVQRGPYGPAFGEGDDDPEYRQELLEKIHHGLGLVN